MNPEYKAYQTLFRFALEADIGFSLLIVQSDNYDLQTRWHERLARDLSNHGIKLIAIEGRDLPVRAGARGISPNIEEYVPKSGFWVLSLFHLDEQTRPVLQSILEENRTGYPVGSLRPAPLITRLNVERDDLAQNFPVPCMLWVSPSVVRQLAEYAPDFYDIRDAVLDLSPEKPGFLNQTGKAYDVFISHKSEYRPWTEVLAQNLKNQGYRIFLDSWEPAKNIASEMYRGLYQSRKGILIVTPEAIESGWIREEYDQMMVQQRKDPDFTIIPLLSGKAVSDSPFLSNLQWLDFRDPETYSKAFCHLICAIENRTPETEIDLEGELIIPELGKKPEREPNQSEISFVEDLFELFHIRQAVLLLAQADRGQSAMKYYLLERAEKQLQKKSVLHLVPPYSPHTNMEDYFSMLGRQCHFSKPVTSAVALMKAFENELADDNPLFILTSGFENSCDEGRKELAGIFRNLSERYMNFRMLICGGEKLADIYYTGDLSFLNSAEIREWPELTPADVHLMAKRPCSDQDISDKIARELLTISGGHPRLLEQCLLFYRSDVSADLDAYQDALIQSPFVWQLFAPFVRDKENRQKLCRLLQQNDLWPDQPYLFDPLLRRLYWKNMLKRNPEKNRLSWRCEALREAGLRILGCDFGDFGRIYS